MKYDENEEEPITTPDTNNQTKLNATEGDRPTDDLGAICGGGQYWSRLRNLNTGAADSFGNRNQKVARRQEALVAWDVIAGQLELNSYQKREGRRLVPAVNGKNQVGASLYKTAFALAVYVVRKDSRSRREYHPRRKDKRNDDRFLDVADDHGFDDEFKLHGLVNRVEERLK